MQIYVFRHAQKAMDFSSDPDLTVQGHSQAQKLVDKVLKKELPTPTALWVSPRKRTCSTFRPLADQLGLPLQLEENLLEQKPAEKHGEFIKRIRNLFEKIDSKKNGVIFLCSHYDWVIEAMRALPTDIHDPDSDDFSHWSPCQYAGFELGPDGIYKFLELKRMGL